MHYIYPFFDDLTMYSDELAIYPIALQLIQSLHKLNAQSFFILHIAVIKPDQPIRTLQQASHSS